MDKTTVIWTEEQVEFVFDGPASKDYSSIYMSRSILGQP